MFYSPLPVSVFFLALSDCVLVFFLTLSLFVVFLCLFPGPGLLLVFPMFYRPSPRLLFPFFYSSFILRFASACFFYLYYLPVLFSGITAGCLFFYLPAFGSFFFDARNINLILRSEWYKTVLETGFKHESSLKKLQFLALQLHLSALIWHLTSRPFKWNRRPTRRGDPRLSSGELTAVISPMFLHLNWAVTILSFTAASWLVRALSDRLPARLVASARHLTHFSFFIPTSAAVCLRPGSRTISLFITGGCDTICDNRSTWEHREETELQLQHIVT